ncbi:MAG: SDR family oxidoreductase [Thermoplasmatota archaeon]
MPRAFVTGAATGIGAATARRLAADGYDLVLHHHRSDIDGLARELRARRHVEILQADLADLDQARRCAKAAGKIDAFVANAGVYLRGQLADLSDASRVESLAVNLEAPMVMIQALREQFSQSGRVVLVGSIAAERGSAHGVAYSSAKSGLVGLTRSLARELAPITVNMVSPGYIDTAMIAGDSPERRAKRDEEVPLGRVGRPEDVADAIAWLCSEGAAYTTGSILRVNGGLR